MILKAEQLVYTGANQPEFIDYIESLDLGLDDIEDDISLVDPIVEENLVSGCMYPDADNYNPEAAIDDGSCEFTASPEFDPGDLNGDGLINILDVVIMINIIINE